MHRRGVELKGGFEVLRRRGIEPIGGNGGGARNRVAGERVETVPGRAEIERNG
jgi:hypothetical protein